MERDKSLGLIFSRTFHLSADEGHSSSQCSVVSPSDQNPANNKPSIFYPFLAGIKFLRGKLWRVDHVVKNECILASKRPKKPHMVPRFTLLLLQVDILTYEIGAEALNLAISNFGRKYFQVFQSCASLVSRPSKS